MTDAKDPDNDRRSWLDPLRPDDVTRARISAAVHRRAAPLLRRRRRGAVLDTAASLARLVAPAAAAAALLFGWVAHEATSPASDAPVAERPVQVEELVRARNGTPPALLTSSSAPSTDLVLEATLRRGESP